MKKYLGLFISIVLITMVAACGKSKSEAGSTGGSGEETHKITINSGLQEDSSMHEGLMKFKEVAEEKSNGQLQVEVFSGATLYASDREAIEAVQSGNIEMTVPPTAPLSGFSKDFMVLDLLFLFDDIEAARAAVDGELGDRLLDTLPEIGLKGLGWGEAGMRHMTNNKGAVTSPEDLKGSKFRVMENPIHIDSFNAFGAKAQPFAYGELYSALQQNIFNAMEAPYNLIEKDHFYEVQEYLTETNHVYTCEVLLMNYDFYNKLPEDLKKVLDEAAKEFTDYQRPLAEKEVEASKEIVKDQVKINEMTPEQKEVFIEKLAPVEEKYAKKLGDLIELARSFNK